MSIRLGTTNPSAFRLGNTAVSKLMLGVTEVWSSFSPLSLSPALWLDASDSSTLYDATTGGSLVAADATIARWEDKSGNARHVTQATSGNRPIRKISQINSKDVVSFETDLLRFMTGSSILHAQDVTVYIVEKTPSAGGSSNRALLQTSNAANGFGIALKDQAVASNRNIFARGVSNGSAGTHTFGVATLLVANRNSASGGTRNLWVNGSSVAVSTNTGSMTNPTAGIIIGRIDVVNYAFQGSIAEILVYPTSHNATNRQAVEAYLNSKWAIY